MKLEELEELEELEKKATPGPWVLYDVKEKFSCHQRICEIWGFDVYSTIVHHADDNDEPNANLIARARNALPALIKIAKAADSLANESKGALGVGEHEFRAILGNTNWECWNNRAKEVKEALKELEELGSEEGPDFATE